MGERGRRLTYSGKSLLLLAALIAAAFAGNFFSLRLLAGFNFLFGSIAVLLTVRLFGIRWGLAAGLAASLWTIPLYGHPYAVIWLCGEPLFVGWLLHKGKRRNILLYDACYWPLVGVPLVWLFFRHAMQVSVLGTVAAMLTYWVVGIANALVASLLLTYIPRIAPLYGLDMPRTIPIHHLIFNILMAVVLIPSIVVMVIHGKGAEGRYLQEMYRDIDGSLKVAGYETRLKLRELAANSGEAVPRGTEVAGTLRGILLDARGGRPWRVILVDDADHVIAATDSAPGGTPKYDSCRNGSLEQVGESGIYRCLPTADRPVPLLQRMHDATFLRRAPLAGTTWSMVVESPFAPYQRALLHDHVKSLLIVLGLNMFVLVISLSLSHRLAAPLYRLSQVTTDLPKRLLRENISAWPESMVSEIDQLIGNFKVMAIALSQRFQEITYTNETLEHHVAERTGELTRANEELQREIAERKTTERQRDHLMEELVNQLRFLQTLIDTIPNPIFYKDADGIYQGCNRAFEESWGLARDGIVGKTAHDLFPTREAEILQAADRELFALGGVQVYEEQIRYSDGQMHTVIIYTATYDDINGILGGLVGTAIDISVRKKAENERDRLMVELQKKNKELEGIVYVASHDLRSPLVNVQGFSRKLAKNCAELDEFMAGLVLDEAQRARIEPIFRETIPRALGFITRSIEKMDSLLNGLLRLSRLGRTAICFETLDMRQLLSNIIASITYQIESAGARVELALLLHPCVGDSVQVTQIFSNLLDNALKYRSAARPLVVHVASEAFDEGVRYCVEDNGIGIPRDQQEKIWEIFHRLNPGDTQGEGLGLTMARRIVDRLGGSIWVESEPDAGSRFYVVLPCAPKTDDHMTAGA
ncbi:PAS domain S-box protein [Geobacter sp. FeAm09]|uniref:sensor histidine kinase n=1 Tax=Geobacter sp. FeAm09 TaxID=2597769 RepID=UPI0011EDE432|nr:ATP-binding protein [Geobacter sp. FeAm09]QEM67092.1 PAS domain S-box protein [Geobacter sp. FeAm09]